MEFSQPLVFFQVQMPWLRTSGNLDVTRNTVWRDGMDSPGERAGLAQKSIEHKVLCALSGSSQTVPPIPPSRPLCPSGKDFLLCSPRSRAKFPSLWTYFACLKNKAQRVHCNRLSRGKLALYQKPKKLIIFRGIYPKEIITFICRGLRTGMFVTVQFSEKNRIPKFT